MRAFRGEDFGGDFEGVIGGGDAAIDGGVEQGFADFVGSDAVVAGGAKVKAEFFFAVEGHGHGEGEKAARVTGEAGAGPDFAPGVPRDQILKWRGEVRGGLRGSVDMIVAEDFAADFHALLVAFAFVHLVAPHAERKFASSGVKWDAASILER